MNRQKKHLLISLIGRTPQILTESLYALIIKRKIPISEIHVLTTKEGEHAIRENLLAPVTGKITAFSREWDVEIPLSQENIHVANDSISSPGKANPDQSMVNLILKLLHSLTEDPDTVLHCSIAGGRKTMSIYFAYALQFFGREDDRLYHVLVHPEEFQNHRDFYYIPPHPAILKTTEGQEISTQSATIDLIEIPFIRLGAKREYIFGDNWPLTYEDMVRLTQAKLEQLPDVPQLIIDLKRNKVNIGLRKIHLSPIELATYYYYAERSKSRQDAVPLKDYEQYFEAADGYYFQSQGLKRIIDIYQNLVSAGTYDNFIRSLDKGNLPFERACQHFSRIKRKIRNALQNDDLTEYYVISAVGTYRKSYGIKLDKSKIILR